MGWRTLTNNLRSFWLRNTVDRRMRCQRPQLVHGMLRIQCVAQISACCASLIQLSKHEWLWRAFMAFGAL